MGSAKVFVDQLVRNRQGGQHLSSKYFLIKHRGKGCCGQKCNCSISCPWEFNMEQVQTGKRLGAGSRCRSCMESVLHF